MRASSFLLLSLAALLVCMSFATGDFDVDTDAENAPVIEADEEPSYDEQTIDLSMTKSGTAMVTAIKSMCSNLDNALSKLTDNVDTAKIRATNKREIRNQAARRVTAATNDLSTQRRADAAARGALAGTRKDCDVDNTRVNKELQIVAVLKEKLGDLKSIRGSDIQAQVAAVNDADLTAAATALLESSEEQEPKVTASIKTLLDKLEARLRAEIAKCENEVVEKQNAVDALRAPLQAATESLREALQAHSAAARVSDKANQQLADAEKAVVDLTATQKDDRAQCQDLKSILDSGLITCRADSELRAMANNYKDVTAKLATCVAALKKATTTTSDGVTKSSVERFDRSSAQGQILAQAACVALRPGGGWTFAVKRTCSGTRTCAQICEGLTESQAGRLGCFESLHIYGNQPAESTQQVGLKVHKYRNCHASSCGPNYCCCKNGATVQPTAEIERNVEEDSQVAQGDADEEPAFDVDATTDVELSEDAELVRHTFDSSMVYQTEGQMIAQSACVALNGAGAWTFAIRRTPEHTCSTVCSSLTEGQAGKLSCFNSLHVYGNGHANGDHAHGLKTYKYMGCGGGWGPNYCCCRGTGSSSEDAADAAMNEVDSVEDEEAEPASGVALLESASGFERYGLAGQIEAESVALTMSTRNGWTYAVKRHCTSGGTLTCHNICNKLSEAQATSSGSPYLKCTNSLHIYGNQPAPGPHALGLKTYRYNSCSSTGCGPNYCLCWAGYNNANPN